ncbi:hypothetical protein D5S18_05955 [Nocardia panacis]|uniref:Uncharacterized protein n=1 Tax=Nocardia panacis TaxID=2340916 RepID=A0A3A4KXJ6_9NOCA|nr:hypothetical protein [Nocardia panacis]RJO78429.1 hypothetical protein D5S18_05955 [Nocardia panacis]
MRVSPEALALSPAANIPKDYNVARRLMGLDPISISPTGVVTRGPTGGGVGGGGTPPPPAGAPPAAPPPAGGGVKATPSSTASSAGAPAGGAAKSTTTARVGTPDMRPIQVGGPDPRGTAQIAGLTLAFMGVNFALNLINDYIQTGRVRRELARLEPVLAATRAAHPDTGTLLVFFYTQAEAPSESLIQPGPVFSHLETATGLTRSEATLHWQNQPAIRPGAGPGVRQQHEEVWIPPAQQAGPAALTTPFRTKVALATFAAGRETLQDVEWGGVTGFDDEGTTRVPDAAAARFIVLRVPSPVIWYDSGIQHRTDIPVQDRPAAAGGAIPVVNLDPSIPFYDVAAACVFPADDATAALFDGTRPTKDNLGLLRHFPNFTDARWVRPENIRILQRF